MQIVEALDTAIVGDTKLVDTAGFMPIITREVALMTTKQQLDMREKIIA